MIKKIQYEYIYYYRKSNMKVHATAEIALC